jgi:subtilisin family serine protease
MSMGHRSWLRRAAISVCAAAVVLAAGPAVASAAAEKYLVLYKQGSSAGSAATDVQRAGGELVANYSQIGVLVAQSSDAGFAGRMSAAKGVDAVAATSAYAVKPFDDAAAGPQPGELPNAPATDADTFSPLQWDMRQIHTPEAHAITGGSPTVVVGDIDTGLDKDHPDLVENIDFSKSVSCESGAPNPSPAAWDDRIGHGTHTAGTIAAADNGFGIVGTAPNVKLAGIKSSNDAGFFFPEMVVCSFMWAGSQHLDVTNNSYFADPFLYNCHNDAAQRAIWKAERRAIDYAQSQGVTVVASAGNNSDDLSHPGVDETSPDFPPGSEQTREVGNECTVVPVEVSGVVGVSATGHNEQVDDDPGPDYLKSYYSSYGVSAVDLTAPGGDRIFGVNAEAPNGRVLSTWPSDVPCGLREEEAPPGPASVYCYAQGTSMAAPHVSGVAALIVSRFGDASNPQNGKMRPGQVEAYLQQTADPQPCPSSLPAGYAAITQTSGEPQECQGGLGQNSWYGNGQVNALRAVTHDTGN